MEPPKLNVKTYNKRVVKTKKVNQPLNYCSWHKNGGDFRAIKPLQIAPENDGNRISEALKLKIFRGSMPQGPLGATAFGGRLSEPHPLRQIMDPPKYSVY